MSRTVSPPCLEGHLKIPDPEPFPPLLRLCQASKDSRSKTLFPPICPDLPRTVNPASSHDTVPVLAQHSRTMKNENVSDLDTGGGLLRTFPGTN